MSLKIYTYQTISSPVYISYHQYNYNSQKIVHVKKVIMMQLKYKSILEVNNSFKNLRFTDCFPYGK